MKVEKAISWLKYAVPIKAVTRDEFNDFTTAVNMAIEALEKQIPKKFKMVDNYTPVCPVCGEAVWDMEWCNSCGQKLDTEED